LYTYDVRRTTIMADEETVARLKGLAADRGVPFSEVVREALEQKAAEYRPKPRSIGIAESRGRGVGARNISGRVPPRSWR
jgi:predicted transcriptional regulator